MRYTGPRNRIARRNGIDLELKTFGSKSQASLMKKISVPPGQHGTGRRMKKTSENGKQLREKQALRMMFGLSEKQLSLYFKHAKKAKGNTGVKMCQLLESRLDNVVYRSSLAPTRAAARQLVNHGHVAVDGKKQSVASFQVKVGNKVTFLRDDTKKIPAISTVLDKKDITLPVWIERKGAESTLMHVPDDSMVSKMINLRLIIEFYSKK